MGLVRLRRALGGAIPPFDPIGYCMVRMLGDADTGPVVTRQALARWRAGIQPRPWAARKGRTRADQVGFTPGWETTRSPSGETWDGRYSWGQPREIDG